jgi:hypothetical protein
MIQALRPMTVMRGANHHRSVRNVRAVIEARACAPPGLVAVVVMKSPARFFGPLAGA